MLVFKFSLGGGAEGNLRGIIPGGYVIDNGFGVIVTSFGVCYTKNAMLSGISTRK